MKVVECAGYGSSDVLKFRDRPVPVPYGEQVLVKVHATTVTSGDWRIRSLQMPPGFAALARPIFGFSKPRQPVLGSEASGVVVCLGPDVKNFQVGDRVVLFDGAKMGCHAEFKVANTAKCMARIPDHVDYINAAGMPFGGTTALHFLRKTAVEKGDRVLVIGASGSVGSSIVQLAKHFGSSVTGVCSRTNIEMVRSLGADDVIDYTTTNMSSLDRRFDVVFETVGSLNLSQTMQLAKDGGRVAIIAGGLGDMLKSSFSGRSRKIRVSAGPAEERAEDLHTLVDLASKNLFRPLIDCVLPFSEISKAHDRVESLRKRGSIVISPV